MQGVREGSSSANDMRVLTQGVFPLKKGTASFQDEFLEKRNILL